SLAHGDDQGRDDARMEAGLEAPFALAALSEGGEHLSEHEVTATGRHTIGARLRPVSFQHHEPDEAPILLVDIHGRGEDGGHGAARIARGGDDVRYARVDEGPGLVEDA